MAKNRNLTQVLSAGVLSDNAFHEKAGLSQEIFHHRVATVAMLPSALSKERFSLGARWASSFQPVLLSVWRPVVPVLQNGTWARR
jgi:hypothetical protein